MKSQLQTAAVSLVSALVGALVVSWAQAKHDARPVNAPVAPSAAVKPVEVRLLASGADPQLAQRLSALEQQLADRPAPAAAAQHDEALPDREEAEVYAAEHRAEREASFAAQVIDHAWAGEATRNFETDFAAFEDAPFSAGATDCRTSVCRTPLTFPSYDAARAGARKVIHHEYANNCTREILTPAPQGDPNQPYVATVYFDCANLRNPAP